MTKLTVQITPKLISDISNRNILTQKLRDLSMQHQRCDVEIRTIRATLKLLDAQIAKAK